MAKSPKTKIGPCNVEATQRTDKGWEFKAHKVLWQWTGGKMGVLQRWTGERWQDVSQAPTLDAAIWLSLGYESCLVNPPDEGEPEVLEPAEHYP